MLTINSSSCFYICNYQARLESYRGNCMERRKFPSEGIKMEKNEFP